jgi:hemolysin activation/secretion protein
LQAQQPEIKQEPEVKPETKPEETKVEEVKKEPEPPKVPVKTDFVPDENFSWNLDLEAIATKEARK